MVYELLQFGAGVAVGALACVFVVRNQLRKNEDLKAYKDALEAKVRAASDELWDDVSAVKARVAELAGKVSER